MVLRSCSFLVFPVIIVLLATGARAQTATLDSIDVQPLGDELVALRDGGPPTRISLEPQERLLSLDSRGVVGIALTNRRFLAVSVTSSGWKEMRLRREDGAPLEVQLAANLALLVAKSRILAFDGPAGQMTETRLRANEVVLDSGANERTAVIVTNRRAIGFAAGAGMPTDLDFRVRESLESLRVLATSATVRTGNRVMVFSSSSGRWSPLDLPVD